VGNSHKNGTSDVERLVEASQAGDRYAFDGLVRLYQRRAMHLAIRLLGNANDATDVVQQAFVMAYLKIEKLREPNRFESWLLKIVANLAIDQRTDAKHRAERRSEITRTGCGCRDNRTTSPVEKEIRAELEEAIQRAMLKLSRKEAKAISLFGFDDLSHKEVARIMGCSVGSARWYVFRARRKLGVLLKDHL
jgi:RNA polymerase sigma-70 factor (ECF subfamily)